VGRKDRMNLIDLKYDDFLKELKQKVLVSRQSAALSVNKELIILYHLVNLI
jgi:hypothetical protein